MGKKKKEQKSKPKNKQQLPQKKQNKSDIDWKNLGRLVATLTTHALVAFLQSCLSGQRVQ